jgi:microcystin degradation protein MlrC
MRETWRLLRQVEDESGWPASCLCPHPWLDVPDFTVTLAGYADVDPEQISRGLAAAARALWAARRDLYRPMPDLAAAWDEAEASAQRPVILVDSGDVVLAGAPGDSTAILHFLQDRRTRLRCLLHVTCAEATAESRRWSLGESARCLIGTGQASGSSGTVEVCGRVACISDAPYVASGAYLGGMNVNAGRRVVIEWQTHTLVVAERPDPAHDPAFFRSLGIEPSRYDVIVVKSHNTFRPAYRSISERIIRAATPGATNPDLRALPYGPEMRRLYPLNQDAPASFGRE